MMRRACRGRRHHRVDSVCKIANSTVTTHAVVSGDFNSAYTVKVTSKREGGAPAPGHACGWHLEFDARGKMDGPLQGRPEAGRHVMGGRKFNVHHMQKMQGAPAR